MTITRWSGTPFAECDKGIFEVALLEFDFDICDWKMIAYSAGGYVRTTEAFTATPERCGAINAFADGYSLEIA